MKTTQNKTERIYSLDSLRAIMMLLGLVLHSAISYVFYEYSIIKDPRTTDLTMDYLVDLIHSFRMPIFFVVAGFFGALLFYEKQPLEMIKNRTSRIVYPFIVFLFILWPLIVFSTTYTSLRFSGSTDALAVASSKFSNLETFIPQKTKHLWFLYYLILITCVSILFGLLLKKLPILSSGLTQVFNWIFEKSVLRVLFLASVMCFLHEITKSSELMYSPAFKPELNTFVHYSTFYFVGWFLFQSKHLLGKMVHYDWIFSILGVIVFTINFLLPNNFLISESYNYHLKVILNSITVSLFTFGITGLFIRYGSNYSSTMRYLSDSSYWVYLIHYPFTILIPGLIAQWPLSAMQKFLFVFIATTIISYTTYHYLVRATFIGNFLNGRKYNTNPANLLKSNQFLKDIKKKSSPQLLPIKD